MGFKVTVSWWRANCFEWRKISCQNGPNSGFAQMLSSKQTNTFSHLALFKKSTHPQSTWDMDSFRSLGGSHQQAATPQILHVQFKEISDFLGNLSLFGFRNWDGFGHKKFGTVGVNFAVAFYILKMSITSEIGFDFDLEYEKFLINGWQWLDIVLYKKISISCWSMPMVDDFQLWAVEVVIQLPRSILPYSNHCSDLQFSSVDLFLLSCDEYQCDYVVISFTRLFLLCPQT